MDLAPQVSRNPPSHPSRVLWKRNSVRTYFVVTWHLSKEFLLNFGLCFLFFFAIFFVNQILLMARTVLSERAALIQVFLLLVYAIPSIIALTFPFAALVAALMTVGRISSENEYLAMMASGISPRRVLAPLLLLAALVSGISFAMNDYFLPRGNAAFANLWQKMISATPALELKPWSSRRYKDVTVVTGSVSGPVLLNTLIFDHSVENGYRTITADRAIIKSSGQSNMISLRLEGVWQLVVFNDKPEKFEWSTAKSMEYNIDLSGPSITSSGLGPQDLPAQELMRFIKEMKAAYLHDEYLRTTELFGASFDLRTSYLELSAPNVSWQNAANGLNLKFNRVMLSTSPATMNRNYQVYWLEYYKKYSIPVSAICFIILAFPVGLLARRSGRAVGFGVGILICTLYWSFLLIGNTLGIRLGWSAFLSMWGPDALVLIAAAILFFVRRTKR